ncbi:MAG: hypothetical protein DME15_14600 [Candidatus Rokuibacteriota bacterium]|nr:MAG: hypothetical protein DME15_14600 [Candidatus Rokubacteria bacterium]
MGRTLAVTFEPVGRTIPVTPGQTFLRAAQDAGIDVMATCGGRGRCHSCRIKIVKGSVPPPTIMDTVQLGHDEVREGFRLSCQTAVSSDCAVMVMPPIAEGGHQILSCSHVFRETTSLDSGVEKRLIKAGLPTEEHHQTSDVEEILAALGNGVAPDVPLDLLRKVPALLRDDGGALTVTTFNKRIIDLESGDTTTHRYGMAFDIGTTSIVGFLLDLATGEQLAAVGSLNPQAVYGGDLMSRIAFAQFNAEALKKLQTRVLAAINGFVKEACDKAKVAPAHVYKVVIVGNTCMHHIFLGIDPTHVGLAPYAPSVRSPIVVTARELLVRVNPNAAVCFLPIVAGFVGADTMAVVLATRIYDSPHVRVAVDIGTNGEVVMGSRRKLVACSAPAGPALEGAQIKHGMRGALGAIEKVEIVDDVVCGVIGGVPPIGICGSGLIDAVAKMLDAKIVGPSGLLRIEERDVLAPALRDRLVERDGERQFVLAWAAASGHGQDITISQQDIRQLQLAKGAIYSGILMLKKVMGVQDGQIKELMLAGGFGNYINIESAVRIHLLPELPVERIRYVGNAAALGAQMALLSETERNRAIALARSIEHVSLAARPDFQDIFIEAICFPGDEAADMLLSGGA